MRRTLIQYCLLLAFLAALNITALAQTGQEAEQPRELRADIRNLLTAARMAGPEVKSDALLRLARSRSIANTIWPRDIIEEAYIAARQVKNPVRMKAVPVPGVSVDTHSGYLSYAFDQKFDSYSLQSRAIRQMLSVDKVRARQMVFELNGRLGLKKVGCKSALVYDVTDLYATVGEVAKAAFSKKEIDEGVRALFLVPWFDGIESPSQIGPALDLLLSVQGSQADRQLLSTAMARALSTNYADDRSFAYAIERTQIPSKMYRLASGVEDASKTELRSAFREFLLKNLSGTRCAESDTRGGRLPEFILASNKALPDKPIETKDIADQSFEGNAEIRHYWRSESARRLSDQLRKLRAEKPDADVGELAEWEGQLTSFLDDLGRWSPSSEESDSEVFNQKCVLYRTLVGFVPEEKLKRSVVLNYMRFLNSTKMEKDNFIEWHIHAAHLGTSQPDLFQNLISEVPNTNFKLLIDLKAAKL